MNPDASISSYDLAEGLRAVVRDETRHYYGGYFHVCLRVEADVVLVASWFESPSLFKDACGLLGSTIRFSRVLEKMAVPINEVDGVKQALLKSFETNLIPYLVRPDFPGCFAISEYVKALKKPAALKDSHQ